MPQPDWSDESVLGVITKWPTYHNGAPINFAELLEATDPQNGRKTAHDLIQLRRHAPPLIRVDNALDSPLNITGLRSSEDVLERFRFTVENLARREKQGDRMLALFRKQAPRMASRRLIAIPVVPKTRQADHHDAKQASPDLMPMPV